jgi:hypothetical protein
MLLYWAILLFPSFVGFFRIFPFHFLDSLGAILPPA